MQKGNVADLRDGYANDSRPKKRAHKTVERGNTPPRVHEFINAVTNAPGFKKGGLTAQAQIHDMEPMEFAKHVLANPESYNGMTRRRAQFAVNAQKRS